MLDIDVCHAFPPAFLAILLTRLCFPFGLAAFFGSTFPHLFLQSYSELRPAPCSRQYIPRVFGFKVHQVRTDVNESCSRAARVLILSFSLPARPSLSLLSSEIATWMDFFLTFPYCGLPRGAGRDRGQQQPGGEQRCTAGAIGRVAQTTQKRAGLRLGFVIFLLGGVWRTCCHVRRQGGKDARVRFSLFLLLVSCQFAIAFSRWHGAATPNRVAASLL